MNQERIIFPLVKIHKLLVFLGVFIGLSVLKAAAPYCGMIHQLMTVAIITVSYGFYVKYATFVQKNEEMKINYESIFRKFGTIFDQ